MNTALMLAAVGLAMVGVAHSVLAPRLVCVDGDRSAGVVALTA